MLEALSGEKMVGMKWRNVLMLVPPARMSLSKESRADFLGCSPVEAAGMVVVRCSMRLRDIINVCVLIGKERMLQSCDRFICTVFLHL